MQRRPAESVEVYLGKPPGRPHEEVGLFYVYQGLHDNLTGISTEELFQTLRVHAALRGCDAVQLLGTEFVRARQLMKAACDIYVDDEGRKAAAALRPPPPLPREGTECAKLDTQPCPEPLICETLRCVSPYRVPVSPRSLGPR